MRETRSVIQRQKIIPDEQLHRQNHVLRQRCVTVLPADGGDAAEIFVLRVIGGVAAAEDFRQRVANEQPILRAVGVKP